MIVALLRRVNEGDWLRRSGAAALAGLLLLAGTVAPNVSRAEANAQPADPRLFTATGYRIDNDRFWDYFQKRGGVRTFGYPASREFQFLGCTTQFFQRIVVRQCGSNVETINLLDAGLLPYNRINGSEFPAADVALAAAAPAPRDADYGQRVIEFVRQNAPDIWEGEPVRFFETFQNSVQLADAFPAGDGDESLLPLFNLEMWGVPTSAPMRDPRNSNFIYQRFQRGIMHYDKSTGQTQALLLADYLKAIITGQNLPLDLEVQAAGSPLFKSMLMAPPAGTDYGQAFAPLGTTLALAPLNPTPTTLVGTVPTAVATAAPAATPAPAVAASVPITVSSPDYGLSLFIWGNQATTNRDLKMATDAGFRWQKTLFQWKQIEGRCRGCFDWTEADRVVKATNDAGVKLIARLDFQPEWARADRANNGPPDNYQDFNNFVSALVSRYKTGSPYGRLHAIQVWNEVNLSREWGGKPVGPQQAADYVRLLSGAYRAAKAADPNVVVISSGLSPTGVTNDNSADDVDYLQWMFDGGMKGGVNYDVMGAHGNTQAPVADAPINSLARFPHPSFYFRRVEQLRDVQVRNGDANRQIWLLEFGWTSDKLNPNYAWFAVTEEQKAQNIVRAFQFARQNWQPWMGVMTLWTLPDPSWNADREELWWAITNRDGSPRPAYSAVKTARQNGTLP